MILLLLLLFIIIYDNTIYKKIGIEESKYKDIKKENKTTKINKIIRIIFIISSIILVISIIATIVFIVIYMLVSFFTLFGVAYAEAGGDVSSYINLGNSVKNLMHISAILLEIWIICLDVKIIINYITLNKRLNMISKNT